MTTSVFSGAFGLFLLFWLCIQTGNMFAACTTVMAALAGWVVNVGQDIDSTPLAAVGAAVSVICGAVALISVAVKIAA